MEQLELQSQGGDDVSGRKNATMSRLQQESESFLASLHSTPDLASTLQTVANKSKTSHSSKIVTQKFQGLHKLTNSNNTTTQFCE